MTTTSYEIRLCQNPACGLRYPLTNADKFGSRCPACLGETRALLKRTLSQQPNIPPLLSGEGPGVRSALLDNIRSAWNVGSIFRTADGLGLSKLYLCGITPTPDNKSVQKTSLGAEKNIAWEHSPNALETAKKLKVEGCRLIALEQDERAVPIFDFRFSIDEKQPAVLILGNEVTGVDPEILDLCNQIAHIPMCGEKGSFNVEVAFAIAAYTILKQ